MNEEEKAVGVREHMYRCLVREVIKMRVKSRDVAHRWLHGNFDNTGKYKKGWSELHPESNLEKDVKQQWINGNRGNTGEWK